LKPGIRQTLLTAVPGILAVLAWYAFTASDPRRAFFIGSPARYVSEFLRLARSGELFTDTAITGSEALAGFIIGNATGAGLGLLMWRSRILFNVIRPYIFALGNAPLFAFAPIIVVWFGTGFGAKVVVATMSTFFLALLQAYKGAEEASRDYAQVIQVLGGDKHDIFRKVVVPSSLTWVVAAFHLNVGQALLGAFLGEFISSEAGLGHVILVAGGLYNIPLILVAVTMIVFLSWLLSGLVGAIEKPMRRILVMRL
jgi:NitT/TauT family transport system permease protein